MINVHSKLIKEDLQVMGVDAFAVLMCITSHINKSKSAWPGIDRLRKMTGLSRERTYAAIKKLIDLGHIERKQINEKGNFGFVIYRLTSKYLSIFIGVNSCNLIEDNEKSDDKPYGDLPYDGKPYDGKPYDGKATRISIDKKVSIDKKEVLVSESERTHESLPEPMQDWVEVAQAMSEYAEGEGATQWRFMCQVSGYNDKPIKILSTWASKAQQYDLKRWRENFPKLLTWMKNERNNQPTQPSNIKKWNGA
jgi:hypothetical protein